MLIDCNTCVMRDRACGECVVPLLLGLPEVPFAVEDDHWRALQVLVDAGLIADVASCLIEDEPELAAAHGSLRHRVAG